MDKGNFKAYICTIDANKSENLHKKNRIRSLSLLFDIITYTD